jgi:hypothetical protein
VLVAGADPQVAVEGDRGLVPERQRPLATTLAQNQEYVQLQVDVGQLQAGQLGPARASVEQEHEQGGVAAVLEALPGAGREQPPQAVVWDNRDGLLGDDRWSQLGHRVGGDLLLFLQPAVQDLEHLVVGGGGASRPPGE